MLDLLEPELAKVKDFLLTAEPQEYPAEPHKYFTSDELDGYVKGDLSDAVRLRLDFEIKGDLTVEDMLEPIMDMLGDDLEDLIVKGDRSKSADPLFKAMDGAKVRNAEPVDINLLAVRPCRDFNEKRGTTQVAVYVILYVQWQDNN